MADYRTLFDSNYLYAFHLMGRAVSLKIARVTGGELTGEGGHKARKPLIYFANKEKPLAINKTNGKTIAALYGPDTDKWIGQWITIYPTTTQFGGEQRECIRVKAERPQPKNGKRDEQSERTEAEPYDGPREPGSDG